MKLFRCKVCGQVVKKIKDTEMPLTCCGKEMEEIIFNDKEDNLKEKHIPTYEINNNKVLVKVGSVLHPSSKEHYIEWITIVTDRGCHTKMLTPGENPIAVFLLDKGEKLLTIYAYCNIHSLWKKDVCRNLGCSL